MNKIDQIISDIEAYLDGCKYRAFSQTDIIVEKETLEEMLSELRSKAPDEIKKYQKLLNNRENIIAEAKEQAESILNEAQIQTAELINEHEIMQRAYAQANQLVEQATQQAQQILDHATQDANEIRMGAMSYTDDMLAQLERIIEHSINDNKEKYTSLISGLDNVLSVVKNNRKELNVSPEEEQPQIEIPEEAAPVLEETVPEIPEENVLGDEA